MTELFDYPNKQVLGLDPPWVEGTGGELGEAKLAGPDAETVELDSMTKDELLAYAQSLGITPANASMTKDEIRAGIDAYQG
jgi:hypothetical protein